MPSATIKLFLVHGDAKRLRTAELSNWTGKAVAGPRSELDGVLGRDEAAKSGVYFLNGTDSESGKSAVYVGEAESIRDRLRSHLDKDFWNHVVFFISKDENLNSKQQVFLDFVLSHYVSVGVGELDQDKLNPLLRLKYHNSIADAVADLGRAEDIGRVFTGFQKYLYQQQAA
jgi:hypothetical protein